MAIRCAYCSQEKARAALHRVGGRVLCAPCYREIRALPDHDAPDHQAIRAAEEASLHRLDRGLAAAGLVAKTAFFGGLFWWAGTNAVGAAALEGIVVADVVSWVWLSLADWEFRRATIRWGAVFEVLLVAAFLSRATLFDIPTDGTLLWAAFSACLLYGAVKVGLWYAETILEITGVSTT